VIYVTTEWISRCPARRFPPPWSVEELDNKRRGRLHPRLVRGRFLENQHHMSILQYSGSPVCSVTNTPRITVNIAKLPELVGETP
jgi:hypothetical protein